MWTIAIIAQKGGSGKTTLAECLAVAAERAGRTAAILDIDPQTTAASWHDRRTADTPAVIPIPSSRIKEKLAVARQAGADLVFIDTPARLSEAALEAARHADLVIIPARATIKDLERVEASLDLVKLAGSPPVFAVVTQVRPQGDRHQQALEALQAIPLTVCPSTIGYRVAYEDADTLGQTPQETEPGGKAAAEIELVYRFTIEVLNQLTVSPEDTDAQRKIPARRAG